MHAEHEIPYVLPLSRFPSTEVKLFRDFPDVFAEEYADNAKDFALQLNEFKERSLFNWLFPAQRTNLGFWFKRCCFRNVCHQPAFRIETWIFAHWLSNSIRFIFRSLMNSWNLKLNGFEDVTKQVFEDYPSEIAKARFLEIL